jgi:hypothetical protein
LLFWMSISVLLIRLIKYICAQTVKRA